MEEIMKTKRAPNKRILALRALFYHLDQWEKQGHTTVSIRWLRRHFADFKPEAE